MPRMNGPTATRSIRCECEFDGMIVALTGSLLDEAVNEFKASGVTSLVPKPLQHSDLERILLGHTIFISILDKILDLLSSKTSHGTGTKKVRSADDSDMILRSISNESVV